MKIAATVGARLDFLARVTEKESRYLLDTDGRLFFNLFTLEEAKKLDLISGIYEEMEMVRKIIGEKP